jgi:catechol 2,3-dioxygenase-like lactoylglutathione lyase family enzyme
MFTSVCPILPSSDLEKTKAFYAQLGFKLAFDYPEHGYMILVQDEVELHFFRSPQHVAETSDHGAFVRVEDANALSAEYEALELPQEGIPRFIKAEKKPGPVFELAVIDEDGNLIRMGHVL